MRLKREAADECGENPRGCANCDGFGKIHGSGVFGAETTVS